MATYFLASWDAAEFTIISGADPFSDYNDPNYSALGTVFTVGATEVIEVQDNDSTFDETDFNQEFFGSNDPDGRNASDGTDIDPEYSYTIRKDGAPTDGSQDVVIYVYEMGVGPGADGFVSDSWIEPGAQYEIVQVDVVHHEIAYSNIYICFAAETRLRVPGGWRPVGAIMPGDLVWTADAGFQPLRWRGVDRVGGSDAANPVLIRAGAIGPGMPAQDVRVSPQHRIALRSRVAERMFGAAEVLAPAKALVGMPGIEREAVEQVDYVHLLFDRHHILDAEGMMAESLYLGPQTLRILGTDAIAEIAAITPPPMTGIPARPLVRGRRLNQMLKRHLSNRKPLYTAAPGHAVDDARRA